MSASNLTPPMFNVWEAAGWSKSEAIPARQVLICWSTRSGVAWRGGRAGDPFPDDREYFRDYWMGPRGPVIGIG